jgi:DNA-binding response OmpR family regulator
MNRTILVIDDEREFADLMSLRLAAHGFRVLTAYGGREGLALARQEQPDLILLDVMMPTMDGGEVAQAVRADEAIASTPIIFLTAIVGEDQVARSGGTIGGDLFVPKTRSHTEILERIRERLLQAPPSRVRPAAAIGSAAPSKPSPTPAAPHAPR